MSNESLYARELRQMRARVHRRNSLVHRFGRRWRHGHLYVDLRRGHRFMQRVVRERSDEPERVRQHVCGVPVRLHRRRVRGQLRAEYDDV